MIQISDTLEELVASMDENSGQEELRPHNFAKLVKLLSRIKEQVDIEDVWLTYGSSDGVYRLVLCPTNYYKSVC